MHRAHSENGATSGRPNILANRRFLALWTGNAFSQIGTAGVRIAYPLVVLAVSGSPAFAGWIAFAVTLPTLFFQIPAGVAADVVNRRRLMLAAQAAGLLATAAAGAALVTGEAVVAVCLVAAFVEGTAFVFFKTAEVGAVRDVVHEDERTTAFTFFEAEQPVANLSGRGFGGVLFGLAQWLPFVANALSYVFCLITLAAMPHRLFDPHPADGRQRPWRRMGDGLRWTWRIPFLRLATVLTGLTNMLFQGVLLLILVVGVRAGRPAWTVGVILAAAGVGGLAGAFAAPRLDRTFAPRTLFLGCLWTWTTLLLAIALSRNSLVLAAAWAGVGAVGAVVSIVLTMARVRAVPAGALGQVVGAAALITDVAFPVGAVLGGYLLTLAGPQRSAWVIFLAAAVLAAFCSRFLAPLAPAAPPATVPAQNSTAGG